MSDVLEKINADKLAFVAARKRKTSECALMETAIMQSPTRGFAKALERAYASGFGLIAEIKKASPSGGMSTVTLTAASDAPTRATSGRLTVESM